MSYHTRIFIHMLSSLSYSILTQYPTGPKCEVPVKDRPDHQAAADAAIKALKAVNGVDFEGGPFCEAPAQGSSDDNAHKLGVKYVYTLELRDTGRYGFILPANQIVPSGKEVVEAMLALWSYAELHQ